jgi:hypothetical protein
MKLEGNPFQNSPFCKGIGYVAEGASMDIAKIELSGRYPERGWVVNEVSYEMAYVTGGSGIFMPKDGDTVEVGEGDVISIEAGNKYAWDGTMSLVVSCNPSFHPDQHKLLEEN